MINVTEFPQRIVNNDATQVSKWSAVHQPIIFKMQRRDIEISSSSPTLAGPSGIKTRLHYSGDVSELTAGDFIYVNTPGANGLYEVLSILPIAITIDKAWGGNAGGGFLNFTTRENYHVETRIYGINNSSSYYLIGTSINKPNSEGISKVDVSSYLKTLVDYKDTFQYDQLNKFDDTQGGRFNIQYRENWTGHEGNYSAISSTLLYYYVNSAQQVQSLYGSNMGQYVPFNNANTDEPKAKFMSDFERPTFFEGYPFSLSFIYSDAIAGYAIDKFEQTKDLNYNIIGTNSYTLDIFDKLEVNRLMLEGNYLDVKFLDVWLEAGDIACRQYVEEDYVAVDYVEEHCGLEDIDDIDLITK